MATPDPKLDTTVNPTPLTASLLTTDAKGTQKYYDQWAATYDKDVATHDYNGPEYLLELVKKYLKTTNLILAVGAGTGILNTEVIDRCTCMFYGTGLEAVLLRENGYYRLHGHDGSEEMLKLARQRGLFEEYFFELLEPGKQSQFKTAYYDAMVCVGCFVPGALDERHVEDLFRTVKPGGISIIGTREMFVTDPGKDFNYPYDLNAKMTKLEEAGKVKLLEKKQFERYSEKCRGLFYVHQVL